METPNGKPAIRRPSGIAVYKNRSLGTAVYRLLETHFPAIPSQPPPLRGTSFHRKEGVTARAPSFGRGCRAQRGGVGLLFCGARVLSYIVCLKRISPLSFIPSVPYPPLRGTFLLRGRLCFENTAIPSQPLPLRGTSFHRKEGVTARAPSFGRGCRAQRGGVGLLFCGAWVRSYIVCLKRIFPLSFIPSVPYPPLRGTFPSRGRLTIRGNPAIKRPSGIAPYIFAALLYFMRRTSTPHSSLLTPHSSSAFIHNPEAARPMG